MEGNVPEIRLKGFTRPWIQRTIGSVAGVSFGGGTPSTTNSDYWNGDIPWLQSSDITEHDIIGVNLRKHITIMGLNNSSAKLIPANSIAIVTRVGVGKLSVVPFDFTTSQDFLSLSDLDIDVWFGAYVMYTKLQKELHSVQGTSIKGITKEELLNKVICVPQDKEEQTIIGEFFRALDENITLHKCKLDGLKELKKGYLQQMFPQTGETVPRLRFEGFTDDWNEVKLGDISTVGMCRRIFKEETSSIGDVPFYKIGTFGAKPDAYISRTLFNKYKEKYPYPKTGDILISASGTIGRTVIYQGEEAYYQDSNIVWLNADETILSNIFLKQFYHIVKWSGLEGTTIKRLYNSNILETRITLPTVQEQTAIGNFFHNLDNQITAQSKKVEQLKELKAAYLQKMFV